MTLKAALVGCGSVSQRGLLPHLRCNDARARLDLVAVVDNVAGRAEATASRFDVPHWFATCGELLDRVDVDLILITTPIQTHFAIALEAIEAGKHVYAQKTMTETVEEADRLLAARDAAGVKLLAAPVFDIVPAVNEIRDILASGAIGDVGFGYTYAWGFGHEHEAVRSGRGVLHEINPLWYFRQGAGPLPDVTVYSVQLATTLLGPVARVVAIGNKLVPSRKWRDETIDIEVDDNIAVLMEFASGTIVTAVGSDTTASNRNAWGSIGLYGTRGAVEVYGVDGATGYPVEYEIYGRHGGHGAGGEPEAARRYGVYACSLSSVPHLTDRHLSIEEAHLYVDVMELVDAIVEDRPNRGTGEQARHVVEVIRAAQVAAATGQAQVLRTTFRSR